MRSQRSFSLEFKRQVVQELLSGESSPAQLCRRHNIGPSLLYHWKRQYSRGKFENEPTEEAALKDRVEKLERLVGKLTLENEFLKGVSGAVSSRWAETGSHYALAMLRHERPARMPAYETPHEQFLLPAQM